MTKDQPDAGKKAGNTAPVKKAGITGLTKANRMALYAAARYLGLETERDLGLRIPFDVYFKDPSLKDQLPGNVMDTNFLVPWEPGIGDGPTSARFAVVDFDATTGKREKAATWNAEERAFYGPDGRKLDGSTVDVVQFRQVSTWALLQNALDFFESSWGLGRRILWGFEGNRLIVVPNAGYGENAYYDRKSKSLQFYYFGDDKVGHVQTCFSSDIVNHEFGHAVLDGIRPHFLEAMSPQTAAFHEFMGDLTAILIVFRNNSFREALIGLTGGNLDDDTILSRLAGQFGSAVNGRPYLRNATNKETMNTLGDDLEPHRLSQVMTGAMFDILIAISKQYYLRAKDPSNEKPRTVSAAQALAWTVRRMQMMAIQPLDLLPPVEAGFRDYALAVLRAEQIANPTDPQGYRPLMIDIFIARGILTDEDKIKLMKPRAVFERPDLDVFHDTSVLSSSRAAAYRFLDDNRAKLFIPARADIVVSDVFTAEKLTNDALRQPRQILLQYVWREDVPLDGRQYGRFSGQTASLLCGGTLALDENGNLLFWARKPGSEGFGTTGEPLNDKWADEQRQGTARREEYLTILARRIQAGMIGDNLGGALGLIEKGIAPLTSRTVDGVLRFELSPHFSVADHDHSTTLGDRQWQISS